MTLEPPSDSARDVCQAHSPNGSPARVVSQGVKLCTAMIIQHKEVGVSIPYGISTQCNTAVRRFLKLKYQIECIWVVLERMCVRSGLFANCNWFVPVHRISTHFKFGRRQLSHIPPPQIALRADGAAVIGFSRPRHRK